MSKRNFNRDDWNIYAVGSGWQAWNGKTRKRVQLVSHGSFSEAVDVFNKKFGPWYRDESYWKAKEVC